MLSTKLDIIVCFTTGMDTIKIPNALQVMMDQLFMNNSLKSWGVFPNKHGKLCLNIIFDICELDQSSKPVSACAFRRISDKQLARNASRNINNNKRRKLNPSISMENKTISQTYQFSKPVYPSPELARSTSVPVTPDAGYIDSQDSPYCQSKRIVLQILLRRDEDEHGVRFDF